MIEWLIYKGVKAAIVSAGHSSTAAALHGKITATKVLTSAGRGAAQNVAWETGKHVVASGMLDQALAGSHATAAAWPHATHLVVAGTGHHATSTAAAQAAGSGTAQAAGATATQSAHHAISIHASSLLLDGVFLGGDYYLGKKFDKRMLVRLEKTAQLIAKRHRVKRADIARALRLDPQGETLRRTMSEALQLGILSKATKATYGAGPALAS
jgi:hypothetical protein